MYDNALNKMQFLAFSLQVHFSVFFSAFYTYFYVNAKNFKYLAKKYCNLPVYIVLYYCGERVARPAKWTEVGGN